MTDCGDGSTYPRFFASDEKRAAYLMKEEGDYQIIPCDAEIEIEFTVEDGVLKPVSGFDEYEDYEES